MTEDENAKDSCGQPRMIIIGGCNYIPQLPGKDGTAHATLTAVAKADFWYDIQQRILGVDIDA